MIEKATLITTAPDISSFVNLKTDSIEITDNLNKTPTPQ